MGRKPLVIKETTREKMHRGIRKRTLSSIRETALDGIEKTECRIHRIVLSGETKRRYREEYKLESLKTALGNLWFDKDFDPKERGDNYGARYIKQTEKFQINLLVNPTEDQPPFQIEIHPKGDIQTSDQKQLLINLENSIPELKPSKVEYTVDQFCYKPMDVENLFWVERFSLYVPYQQGTVRPLGGGHISFDKKRRKALIWNIGDNDKIYERGDDKKKEKVRVEENGIEKEIETWDFKNLNRVRLEHIADRPELRGRGLKTLKDLIDAPQFFRLNKKIWNFRRFMAARSDKRIQEWEDNARPFQELLKASTLENPTKYTEDVGELDSLKSEIIEAMKLFDTEWGEIRSS